MNTFEIVVHFGTNVLELGRCDANHISIITLLHAMNESYTGNRDHPKEDYNVCVQVPWCNERLEVRNDSEIMNVFELFNKHRCDRIVFDQVGVVLFMTSTTQWMKSRLSTTLLGYG
ncbi:hypothetical protein ACOSQ2_008750 [Xanthoceras sorbifolium]